MLRLYNTLKREKADFVPMEPGRVGMYVCGITPYAPAHIGHARAAVAFDVVYRWLRQNHEVTFVRNYTDVDDKIIRASQAEGVTPKALAERYIAEFDEDMGRLGCLAPTVEPRVTDHILEIVETIRCLEARGIAYAVDGDVFYEVARFHGYGQLSGRSLEEMEAGARVEVDRRKRSPHDFALWKSAKPGEPSWPSPWGEGRPGWHIECSAMAQKYLGHTFDIHGGGKDLVFPHHENEIAQSCGAHETDCLAHYWLHNGFVNLLPEGCPRCQTVLAEGQEVSLGMACPSCGYTYTEDDFKMSKSRGNFYPLREILARYQPEALRLLFLTSHYRKPIQFSHALLLDAERRLDKIYETLALADQFVKDHPPGGEMSLAEVLGSDPRTRLFDAMDDDLNTALALGELAELFRMANDLVRGGEVAKLGRAFEADVASRLLADILDVVKVGQAVLGLWQESPAEYLARRKSGQVQGLALTEDAIETLVQARAEARKARDFGRADDIRNQLKTQGVILEDKPDGTSTWSVE